MCCNMSCFVFKQKTAYEMRISDWSSDVCSSDLVEELHRGPADQLPATWGCRGIDPGPLPCQPHGTRLDPGTWRGPARHGREPLCVGQVGEPRRDTTERRAVLGRAVAFDEVVRLDTPGSSYFSQVRDVISSPHLPRVPLATASPRSPPTQHR